MLVLVVRKVTGLSPTHTQAKPSSPGQDRGFLRPEGKPRQRQGGTPAGRGTPLLGGGVDRVSTGDGLLFEDLLPELCSPMGKVSACLEQVDYIYGEINISHSTPWALSHP